MNDRKRNIRKCEELLNGGRCYGNEYFPDGEDETTIGFISEPLTYKEVEDWLFLRQKMDGSFIGYRL